MVLNFNTQVAEDVIISTIQNAIVDGMLGELMVNASSIIGIPPVPLPTTTPPLKTTPKPDSTCKFPLLSFLSESKNVVCHYSLEAVSNLWGEGALSLSSLN